MSIFTKAKLYTASEIEEMVSESFVESLQQLTNETCEKHSESAFTISMMGILVQMEVTKILKKKLGLEEEENN